MRARGSWWRLVGVAVLMAGAMFLVGFMVLMTLNAVTRTLWDPSGDLPLWLDALAMTVVVVLAMAGYYAFAWLTWPLDPTPTPSAPSAMV